ncbi:aminotransferase class V-fold PLP-dependent enzyme [Gemmobacter sp.]|uniref:aminotransferase class V-fold PLP-dependent enzyme n=1 Tax=Gemmobacter sp. TaxID=1898957 RepID=UPI002AFF1A8D|nr:aminotransferase class V-fold PLP-dependent enzyme [Gemmobacter sp.]
MSYFLYHSIGTFAGKEAAVNRALAGFTQAWCAEDDGQWPDAMARRGAFIEAWQRLIGAPDGSLTLAESVTGALYSLMRGLPETRLAGGVVLVAQDCFPSLHFLLAELGRRIGFSLRTVAPTGGRAYVTDDDFLAGWGPEVRLALITWVTSTASHMADLDRLLDHGRRMGSLIGVDVTQGVGIRPYVAQADFTVGSSLKWLCGVSGAGVLQVMPGLLADCHPEFRGWFSQANPFSWDLDAFAFAPDARRFDNGTPNVLPAVASQPGLDHVLQTGVPALAAHNRALTGLLVQGAADLGLPLASPADADRRGGSVMLRLPGNAAALVDDLRHQGIHTDARGAVLRLSPGSVTTVDHCNELLQALRGHAG